MNHARIVASLFALATCASCAQPLRFEVASVKKLDTSGAPGDIPRNADPAPGHFNMRNVPLRMLLEWAYRLKDYEISGPDWIKIDERYEVIAKAAGPVPESQVRQMLQTLLVERFQMKVHRESRELPVY